jgi:hypothetical protein
MSKDSPAVQGSSSSSATVEQADSIAKSDPRKAEQLLVSVLDRPAGQHPLSRSLSLVCIRADCDGTDSKDEDVLREKEAALIRLGELYRDQK